MMLNLLSKLTVRALRCTGLPHMLGGRALRAPASQRQGSVLRLLKQKKHFIPTGKHKGNVTLPCLDYLRVRDRLDSTFDA